MTFDLRALHRPAAIGPGDRCELTFDGLSCEIWESAAGLEWKARIAFRNMAERSRFDAEYLAIRAGEGFEAVPPERSSRDERDSARAFLTDYLRALAPTHTAAIRERVHQAFFAADAGATAGATWSAAHVKHLSLLVDWRSPTHRPWLNDVLRAATTPSLETLTVEFCEPEEHAYERVEQSSESVHSSRFVELTECLRDWASTSLRAFALIDERLDEGDIEALATLFPNLEVLRLVGELYVDETQHPALAWEASLTALDLDNPDLESVENAEAAWADLLDDGRYPRLRQLAVHRLDPDPNSALGRALKARDIAWAPWQSPAPAPGQAVFEPIDGEPGVLGPQPQPHIDPAHLLAHYDRVEAELTIGRLLTLLDPSATWAVDRVDETERADEVLDEVELLAEPDIPGDEPEDWWLYELPQNWDIATDDRAGWSLDLFFDDACEMLAPEV